MQRYELIAMVVLLLSAASAYAQPAPPDEAQKARAAELLAEGNRKFDQALFAEALATFEAAYQAYPSPKLHFSIAQTQYELDRPLEALRHYEQFITLVAERELPKPWAIAAERVYQLQGRVASITLQCNPAGATVSLDGVALGTAPLATAVRVMPGKHVLLVDKAGFERRVVELELAAGAAHTERVELLTSSEALRRREEYQRLEREREAANQRRAAAERAARAQREAALQDVARRKASYRRAGWITLTVGAVALAAAGTTGGLALYEARQVADAAPGERWVGGVQDHYDRAELYRGATYGAAAVAVASLGTGLGLLWYSGRLAAPLVAQERAALVPVLPPGGGLGLGVFTRF